MGLVGAFFGFGAGVDVSFFGEDVLADLVAEVDGELLAGFLVVLFLVVVVSEHFVFFWEFVFNCKL